MASLLKPVTRYRTKARSGTCVETKQIEKILKVSEVLNFRKTLDGVWPIQASFVGVFGAAKILEGKFI
jgi:hypothetical protein